MLAGGVGAVLGLLLGPFLAGLSLRFGPYPEDPDEAPIDEPVFGARWWAGGSASPRRIVLVSALAVVALGASGIGIGWHPELPAYLWLAAAGVALLLIDLATERLPDKIVYPTLLAGIVLLAIPGDWPALGRGLLAALIAGAASLLLALLTRFGLGDVKLLTILGLYLGWLGWDRFVLGVVVGFVLGGLVAIGILIARRAGWKDEIPYGPWLIVGALVSVSAGSWLVAEWLSIGT